MPILSSVAVAGVTVELERAEVTAHPEYLHASLAATGPFRGQVKGRAAGQMPQILQFVRIGAQRGDTTKAGVDKHLIDWSFDVRLRPGAGANLQGLRIGFIQNLVASTRVADYAGGSSVTEQPTAQEVADKTVFIDSNSEQARFPWYKMDSHQAHWVDLFTLHRALQTGAGALKIASSDNPAFVPPLSLGPGRELVRATTRDDFILFLVVYDGNAGVYRPLAACGWRTEVTFHVTGMVGPGNAFRNVWAQRELDRKERKYRLQSPSSTELAEYIENKRGLLFARLTPALGILTGSGVTSDAVVYPTDAAFPLPLTAGKTTLNDIEPEATVV